MRDTWKNLLQPEAGDPRVFPWLGGRQLQLPNGSTWKILGDLPVEYGWYTFLTVGNRTATLQGPAEPDLFPEATYPLVKGFLVGNRLIPDNASVVLDPDKLADQTLQVELVEEGLERFTRAVVARLPYGTYLYLRPEFPEGPEQSVLMAYQDRKDTVDDIPGVRPALDLAFRFHCQQRLWAEERDREREQRRLEVQARQKAEAQRQEALKQIGTATGRRALAKQDFAAAARAALLVADAELLDTYPMGNGEVRVQYRYRHRRLECIVEQETMRVVDSGVCLTDHRTGVKGDRLFTLESLPGVIAEAMRLGKLVVYRHAPGDVDDYGYHHVEDDEPEDDDL